VATRRVETYALLPVRPILLWAAKLGFLLSAGLVFLVWVTVVQLAIHAHAAGLESCREILAHGRLAFAHLGVVLGLAGAVFFFSTLLDRGISAVLAGVLTFGAGAAVFLTTDWGSLEIWVRSWHLGVAGVAVAMAFAGASAFAFVVGRIHRTGRVRRTILGLAGAILLLLMPAAVGAQVLAARGTLEPGNAGVEIRWIRAGSDGRHLALGARNRQGTLHRVWYVRVRDGRLFTEPPTGPARPGWLPEEWRASDFARRHRCEPWLVATGHPLYDEISGESVGAGDSRRITVARAQTSAGPPPRSPGRLWIYDPGRGYAEIAGRELAYLADEWIAVLRTDGAVDLLAGDGTVLRRLYGSVKD
jgi:hypothetical protein